MADQEFAPLANVEVDEVRPLPQGFELRGRGSDQADYLMEIHLDMRINQQTRDVLLEIFAQSEWRILRRPRQPLRGNLRNRERSSSRTP